MGEEKRTGLTARKYLTQLEELDININQDLEMLEEMKANASGLNGVDYGREKVQTSHMGDSLGNAVTRYVAFDGKLHEEIERFTSARNRIITEIRGLHDRKYTQLLFKVYVQFKSIRQAADEMKMSYRYSIQLHNKALKSFGETYKDLRYLA